MRTVYIILTALTFFVIIYSFRNHSSYFLSSSDFFSWIKFYGLPLSLILLIFFIGSVKKEFPRSFLLLVFSSALLPCYIIEYKLSKQFYNAEEINSSKQIIVAAKDNNVDPDLRLRREVLKELNQKGIESYPFFKVGTQHKIYPLGSIPNKKIVLCNELGNYTIYRTDRHGFNNPDSVWDKKEIDVLFLGDSFTHGSCMLDNKNFVNLLREDDANLVNLGNAGNHPYIMLAGLIEYAKPTKPKNIVWMHCSANDIGGMVRAQNDPLFNKYLNEIFSQNLIERQNEITRHMLNRYNLRHFLYQRIDWPSFFKLSQLRTNLRFNLNPKLNINPEIVSDIFKTELSNYEEIFEEIIKRSKSITDSIGSKIYFVSIPTYSELLNGQNNTSKTVEKIVRKNGIEYFDLSEYFLSKTDPESIFSWKTTGHFSTLGSRLTSQFLGKNIVNKYKSRDDNYD